MLKNLFFFLIFSLALLMFFDYKGWVTITPEGKKKAVHVIGTSKAVSKKILKAFQEVSTPLPEDRASTATSSSASEGPSSVQEKADK